MGVGVSANMSSLPTACCAILWAMWKGGVLTSCDMFNRSENNLLLGLLLVMPSHFVLLLVRQLVKIEEESNFYYLTVNIYGETIQTN